MEEEVQELANNGAEITVIQEKPIEEKKQEEAGENRNPDGTFKDGVSGNPNGRPPDTEEQKIIKRAIKELVKEYKEDLAQVLPQIKPVISKKALDGDMTAIKEIHDRVMGKSPQDITSGGEKINVIPIYGGQSINQLGNKQDAKGDIQTPT